VIEVFVSYSHEDAQWVDTWLVPRLYEEGIVVHTDRESFVVGSPIVENIESLIARCHRVLLVLSPEWVNGEWTRFEALLAQYHDPSNLRGKVLPLLLKSCTPPSRIAMLTHADFSEQNKAHESFDHLVLAIKGIRLLPAVPAIRGRVPSSPLSDTERSIIVSRIDAYWIRGYLEQSLHNVVAVSIGMRGTSTAIRRPWHFAIADVPETTYADASISEIFDRTGRTLLLLGAPGSGKTTLLLELVKQKLDRARGDASAPIPVVFLLSSWSGGDGSLRNWLIDELHQKYYVPLRMAAALVDTDELILLLDGLDEVPVAQRTECIKTINQFREEHGFAQIVVTSRTDEYNLANNLLQLDMALALLPLTPEQVENYLVGLGERAHAASALIHADTGVASLAETPLMLNILTLLGDEIGAVDSGESTSVEDLRRQTVRLYVERMVGATRGGASYDSKRVMAWMNWLAGKLQAESQSVFLLENIQPQWLTSQRWLYSSVVTTLVCVCSCMAVIKELISRHPNGIDVISLGMFGLIGTVIAAVRSSTRIKPVEVVRWSPRRAAPWAVATTLVCLVVAFIGWLYSNEIIDVVSQPNYRFIGTNIQQAIPSIVWPKIVVAVLAVSAIRSYYRNTRQGAFGKGAAFGLFLMIYALIDSELDSVCLGVAGTVRHWAVMGTGLPLDSLLAYVDLSSRTGSLWIAVGVIFGGLHRTDLPRKTRVNQGILQSGKNALIVPVLVAVGIALIIAAASSLASRVPVAAESARFQPHIQQSTDSTRTLGLLGMFFLLALPFGGFACLKHYVLRLFLWAGGHLPLRTRRFLDFGVDRAILQQVGGGYIFVHRAVMEYFACK
jgi:eukaryotic-like serine/threonine-protein kinase